MLEASGELLEKITSSKTAHIREGSGLTVAMEFQWDSRVLGVQSVTC